MERLKKDIEKIRAEVEAIAKAYGLDFFETIFELVSAGELNEIASYGGFPTRYPHWRFGMDYDHLSKGYTYGFQKIYELVINNDPCYAYLMSTNTLTDQKLVIAHVFAHCDFFKNNYAFQNTNRKMMDEMANHASRIRYYIEQFGEEEVESFLDLCLSIENLMSVYDPYVFPKYRDQNTENKIPKTNQKVSDILGFLIDKAPLPDWQREILIMVREESYYFSPQRQTKIMNEGWASFWHSKILTEKALKDKEVIDFADHHAGTLATQPGSLNPYKLGIEIFRDIEDRWNKGKFGSEYEACDHLYEKKKWDQKLGKGLEKIFEVRKIFNDVTFIDEFLTEELCEKLKLFVYAYNKRNGTYEIVDRDTQKVKAKLLASLTHFGDPVIVVKEGNFEGQGALLLAHEHEGVDLKISDAKETLERIQKIWKKPVYLETLLNGEHRLLVYDGKEHLEKAA
ncbi:MAG: SpoVR family protein [Deltaproteobacteria bacterium RIFCSPHIGHO2_02_FULL_40_11]|nr:MAG: SpoVR family protein [Deltaproteobacteria bacterium RIFCSPHIGHO2_02_FULL_40_11]